MTTRRPQPKTRRPALSPPRIIAAAARLLERAGWESLTMRALARELQVDPMAIYHYFAGKEALLAALVDHVFAPLDPAVPPFSPAQPWQERLQALAECYLGIIASAPELIRILAAGEGDVSEPTHRFKLLLRSALAGLDFSEPMLVVAANVVVDYLHGFALSAHAKDDPAWREGFAIIVAGLAAPAPTGPPA